MTYTACIGSLSIFLAGRRGGEPSIIPAMAQGRELLGLLLLAGLADQKPLALLCAVGLFGNLLLLPFVDVLRSFRLQNRGQQIT